MSRDIKRVRRASRLRGVYRKLGMPDRGGECNTSGVTWRNKHGRRKYVFTPSSSACCPSAFGVHARGVCPPSLRLDPCRRVPKEFVDGCCGCGARRAVVPFSLCFGRRGKAQKMPTANGWYVSASNTPGPEACRCAVLGGGNRPDRRSYAHERILLWLERTSCRLSVEAWAWWTPNTVPPKMYFAQVPGCFFPLS